MHRNSKYGFGLELCKIEINALGFDQFKGTFVAANLTRPTHYTQGPGKILGLLLVSDLFVTNKKPPEGGLSQLIQHFCR